MPARAFKILALALIAVVWAITPSLARETSWFIDPGQYHSSVHGQMSCDECHSDMGTHPDPARVNRKHDPEAYAERCFECHDAVQDELAESKHGGVVIQDQAKYQDCAVCHDPHRQIAKVEGQEKRPDQKEANNCSLCHESKTSLPELGQDVAKCLTCHATPKAGQSLSDKRFSELCQSCHAKDKAGEKVAVMELAIFEDHPHADLGCMTCHPNAASYPHKGNKAKDCQECHTRHEASVSRDAHVGMACQTCHIKGAVSSVDPKSGLMTFTIEPGPKAGEMAHTMVRTGDTESCRRCHTVGNKVGASSALLPAKGIICLPCHAATLGASDAVSIVALIIFGLGLIATMSFWLGGSIPGSNADTVASKIAFGIKALFKTIFSAKLGRVLQAFVLDGLFQRRLWKVSPARGLIHTLIFMPFLIRFIWGVVTLIATKFNPQAELGWAMLNNDHPLTAFVFDFTGLMVLVGVACAVIRRFKQKDAPQPEKLPAPDWWALGLLLAVVVVGFITEAVRLAMAPALPYGASYAFVARALSAIIPASSGLNTFYSFLWYVHAICWGAFVAYLPFSRMFHIILAPIVLSMRAAEDEEHEE